MVFTTSQSSPAFPLSLGHYQHQTGHLPSPNWQTDSCLMVLTISSSLCLEYFSLDICTAWSIAPFICLFKMWSSQWGRLWPHFKTIATHSLNIPYLFSILYFSPPYLIHHIFYLFYLVNLLTLYKIKCTLCEDRDFYLVMPGTYWHSIIAVSWINENIAKDSRKISERETV